MRVAVVFAVMGLVAPTHAGALTATVTPALEGWFRPGRPVLLRVRLANEGQALTGTLDLVVEGITYRRPFVVGAEATAVVDVLAAVHTTQQGVRVRAESGRGEVVCDERVAVALRRPGPAERLVVAVGEAREAAGGAFGSGAAVAGVTADELPGAAAGLAAADAVVVGIEEELSSVAQGAVRDWVRQGGRLVLVAAGRSEDAASTQAEVEEAALEAWLPAGDVGPPLEVGQGTAWVRGLGLVVAAARPEGLAGHLESVAARPVMGVEEANPELYEWFGQARLTSAVRWRWVAIGAALVLAAAVAARALSRRKEGRVVPWIVGACALLAAVAYAVLVTGGRGTRAAGVMRVLGRDGSGAFAEVVQVGGAGRDHVRVSFNRAAVVVPAYYSPEDVGTWDGVVVEEDWEGGWHLRCAVERGIRRCFVAMDAIREWDSRGPGRGWRGGLWVRGGRFAVAGDDLWRSIQELDEAWDGPAALVRWEALRMEERRNRYEVRWRRREKSAVWPRHGSAVTRPGLDLEWRRAAAE
jgi:hypothetical protein